MRKAMRRRTGALLLLGALAGCAGYEWRKEGASPAERLRDEELCERHAASIRRRVPAGPLGLGGYYTSPPGEEAEVAQRFISCMENRGYQRVRK